MPPYEVTTSEVLGSLLKLPYPSPGITVWLSHETLRVKRTNMTTIVPRLRDYRCGVSFVLAAWPCAVRASKCQPSTHKAIYL